MTLDNRTRGGPRKDYKAVAGIQTRKRKANELIRRLEDYDEAATETAPEPSPSYFALGALTVRPYMAPKTMPPSPISPTPPNIPQNLREGQKRPEYEDKWFLAMLV
ncbi:hypothetical protein IMZ48_03285 [Candidatus Bathyarchaeota archaeon]|nr:hypothetical protein [Candidatus Bathyarchaeota archaeon]